MTEKFLLDSNIFITPYRRYYLFDFAQGFWKQLDPVLEYDNVIVLDVVFSEVFKFEDELYTWFKGLNNFKPVSVQSEPFITNYAKILDYVQNCGFHKEEALLNWSRYNVADPWLIAVAMDIGATIITEEVSIKVLSEKNKSKNAKIPDVAKNFKIKYENLFYFMRQMNFKL